MMKTTRLPKSTSFLLDVERMSARARPQSGPTLSQTAPVARAQTARPASATAVPSATANSYLLSGQQTQASKGTSPSQALSSFAVTGTSAIRPQSASSTQGGTVSIGATGGGSGGAGGMFDTGDVEKAVPAALANNAQYRELRREKRVLQAKLQKYQQEFVSHHGRKVKYRADRLPVEQEYERYKVVKSLLESLEAQAAGGQVF